ncbi:ribbon-helix-helix protein, CopG family [Nocardia sp. NPDC001965]
MSTKGTPKRSFRCDDPLWDKASTRAEQRGDNLSEILRRALTDYAAPDPDRAA